MIKHEVKSAKAQQDGRCIHHLRYFKEVCREPFSTSIVLNVSIFLIGLFVNSIDHLCDDVLLISACS